MLSLSSFRIRLLVSVFWGGKQLQLIADEEQLIENSHHP
jgi:hypothetical protein